MQTNLTAQSPYWAREKLELWEWQYGEFAEGMLPRDSLAVDCWRLWFFEENVVNLGE